MVVVWQQYCQSGSGPAGHMNCITLSLSAPLHSLFLPISLLAFLWLLRDGSILGITVDLSTPQQKIRASNEAAGSPWKGS